MANARWLGAVDAVENVDDGDDELRAGDRRVPAARRRASE